MKKILLVIHLSIVVYLGQRIVCADQRDGSADPQFMICLRETHHRCLKKDMLCVSDSPLT